jgi:hypothetical protein
MEEFKFRIKTIIYIILIAIISLLVISVISIEYIIVSAPQAPEVIAPVYDNHTYEQTPYAIETTSPPPATPTPTPTPLYYQKLKNPDNPCSEDYTIFYRDCMGAIPKSDEYCAYWNYEYRKNCKFAQW